MNSIKNAIVTVTLLAVGYGSYVVLQEPTNGQFPDSASTVSSLGLQNQPAAMSSSGLDAETPSIPEVEITFDGGARSVAPPALSPPLTSPVPVAPETPPASSLAVAPELGSPRFPNQSNQSTGQSTTPELPPLPDLIAPAARELPQLAANLSPQSTASPFESPKDMLVPVPQPSANEMLPQLAPVESQVAPPVAALIEPQTSSVAPTQGSPQANLLSSGPFAEPAIVDDVIAEHAPDVVPVEIPKRDTAPTPALGDVPPIDASVGPIPPATSSDGSLAFENVWSDVQQHLRKQELTKALKTLTPWSTDSTLNKEQSNRCMQLLDQLAGSVIYSRESLLEPAYVVQAGQTLEEIAAEYSVPQELLAKINGIAPPYALSTGEKLKVVRGPFRASVSLFKSELTLYVGSSYAGRFPVTIGRDLPPETAFYEVAEKTNGRSYFDRRQGREVIRGEEGNRYGDQWLGLRGEHITTGHSVGIHGRPTTFGGDEIGSISLDPFDAEDVFSILAVGSRVEIRP